ncbi:MAG: hypothetical protein MUF05_06930 [Candidatus Omnitrophica bacterium]|nr:hypothetical protein [Candidatus Omnitrophota bacterium]
MMKNLMNKLPSQVKAIIALLQEASEASSARIFLVGGCVRDLLLRKKNLDIDICLEADVVRFLEFLRKKQRLLKVAYYKKFFTATVIFDGGLKIDIARSRVEKYPHPGSLPVVSPGSILDDLRRRDFTINAMAISLNPDDYGYLIDIFGGLKDLRDKTIRFLHDLSFIDDPTRILRAARLQQRLGFKIDARTLQGINDALKLEMFSRISGYRISRELRLCLNEKDPLRQIENLQRLSILKTALPVREQLQLLEEKWPGMRKSRNKFIKK